MLKTNTIEWTDSMNNVYMYIYKIFRLKNI